MSSRLGWHGRLAVAGALVATLVVAAPAGAATTVKLDGGITTLRIANAAANRFQSTGITIGADAPARTRRFDMAIPIAGGSIDPATARGTITHRGGVTFFSPGAERKLRALQLRIGATSYLSARIGSRRVNVVKLAIGRGSVSRRGFGTVVKPVTARVTRAAAAQLNRALGRDAFSSGMVLGKVGFNAIPAQISLTGGTTTLTFNQTTQGALQQLGVTLAPIAGAAAGANGIEFPITRGTLDVRTLAGTIEHSGGISLTQGTSAYDLTQPSITLSDAPQLSVSFQGAPIAIADLEVAAMTRTIDPRTRTITLGGAGVKLTTTAAVALNSFFTTQAFRAGTEIATAALTAQAR